MPKMGIGEGKMMADGYPAVVIKYLVRFKAEDEKARPLDLPAGSGENAG